MPISAKLDAWLKASGYEYHCFISWAHNDNSATTELARKLKTAIENSLKRWIKPQVFLDEDSIYGGEIWETTLRRRLCRSVTMVSLCEAVYYHPDHDWCGREWAAMDGLSEQRIPKSEFKTIIPILIEQDPDMPEVITQIQYVDFSGSILMGRYYFNTHEFRKNVEMIVGHIEQISRALQENNSIADCKEFTLPAVSAFAGHDLSKRPFPR